MIEFESLMIDGELSGTGIKDPSDGFWIMPSDLGLPTELCACIESWVLEYNGQHFSGFLDANAIQSLDKAGIEFSKEISLIVTGKKVRYYSAGILEFMWEN